MYLPPNSRSDMPAPLHRFGIANNSTLIGLVNSGPYLACFVLGCWLTSPLNKYFGRRGAIFITATLSFLTCIWGAVTNTWWHLFISRFVLGLGIGPKSATVPMYSGKYVSGHISAKTEATALNSAL